MNSDELSAWIADLRGRVGRGELAHLGPIDVDGGTVASVELAARILLADLDHYDDLPARYRREKSVVARRVLLLADLQRLREQIG